MMQRTEKDTHDESLLDDVEKARFGFVFFSLVIVGGFLFADRYFLPPELQTHTRLLSALLLNIAATAIVFLLTAKFYARFAERRVQQQMSVVVRKEQVDILNEIRGILPPNLALLTTSEIDYTKLFQSSKNFGIVVQGWDGFAKRNSDNFRQLLERNGRAVVITYNEHDDGHLRDMAKRLDRSIQNSKDEIELTRKRFQESTPHDKRSNLTFRKCNEKFSYCLMRFEQSKRNVKYVASFYANHPFSVHDVPSIVVDKHSSPSAFKFFDAEWKAVSSDTHSKLI